MNIIKATIATAAVITCCLGNQYPAKSYSYCESLVDAYIDIRNDLQNMGLGDELFNAADGDAYWAYEQEARKAGCPGF